MKTVTAYQAEDGTLFMSPIEVEEHEIEQRFCDWYSTIEKLRGISAYELFYFLDDYKYTLREYINILCKEGNNEKS